jgi:diadenosine tetraphosphate (Ap4A) HIT family hydrolase
MSPTVFRAKGYRFFFFSREEARMHVHVVSGDGEAKFWPEPDIELSKNYKYSNKQLAEIKALVEEHENELITAWRDHFGS